MVETLHILGQESPAATSNTTLYTAAANTRAACSSLCVANTNATAQSIRVFIVLSGSSAAQTNALYYDTPIPANDTLTSTVGITLGSGDSIVVYASATNVVFHLFGAEQTP